MPALLLVHYVHRQRGKSLCTPYGQLKAMGWMRVYSQNNWDGGLRGLVCFEEKSVTTCCMMGQVQAAASEAGIDWNLLEPETDFSAHG